MVLEMPTTHLPFPKRTQALVVCSVETLGNLCLRSHLGYISFYPLYKITVLECYLSFPFFLFTISGVARGQSTFYLGSLCLSVVYKG